MLYGHIFGPALNAAGIYKITCGVTGDCYVGQSANIRKRWNVHRHHLNKWVHASKYLQNSFNKYGAENFLFSVLEISDVIEIETLTDLERKWFDILTPRYNLAPIRGSGIKKIVSAETRAKQSAAKKGKPLSPEHCRRLSEVRRGAKGHAGNKGRKADPETRARMSAAQKGIKKNLSVEARAIVSARITAINRNRIGERRTDEQKRRMSEIKKQHYAAMKVA